MAYVIYKSDGALFLTLEDGQLDTSNTSLTLLGKNVINYGKYQNSNAVHMLENFASPFPPEIPLTGQLWFDKTSDVLRLKLFNGFEWNSIPNLKISDTLPSLKNGDFWWNTGTQVLYIQSANEIITIGGKDVNSPSATKLSTPRKINNVDFDGTRDVEISSTLTNAITFGVYTSGGEFNGSSALYVDVDVGIVNNPVPSKVVARNSDGDIWFRVGNGTATSAKYADLAEKYLADKEYEEGTVVVIGGIAEITECSHGEFAIGVVSKNPGYMMNSDLEGGTYVALKGRVPVKVFGDVKKGQRLIAGPSGKAIVSLVPTPDVFAIALEDSNGAELIEALVL